MAKKSKSKEVEEDKGSSPPADIFKLLFGKDAPEEPGLAGLGFLPNPTNYDNIDDYNSNKNTNKRDKEEKSQLDEEKKKKRKQKEEEEVNPNLDVAKSDVKKKRKEERREIEIDVNEGEDGIGDLKKEKKKKKKKEEEVNPNLDDPKSDGKKKKEEVREIGVDVNEGEDGIGDLKKEKKNKKKKKKKEEEEEVNVNVLKKEEKGEAKIGDLSNKEKKKKRKRDEIEEEYEARKSGEVSKKVVGEKRKAVDDPAEMMVSKEGFDDESKLLRTIFVGNLPLKLKKKSLLKEFSKYGDVESIRIRSVPLLDSKTPRKGAILQGKINEAVDSVHAYIVFKDEKSAQASLSHNMEMVGGNHIRVDMACPPRKKLKGDSTPLYDHKRTIFVGNLPFDVKDEELYQLFCGINQLESSIEAVRTIRDPNTSMGKGIAYVLFKTKDAANLAIKKKHLKLRDRELRLYHAKADSTPSRKRSLSPSTANDFPAKRAANFSGSDSSKTKSKTALPYQGLRASKSVQRKDSFRPKIGEQVKQKPKTADGTEGKQRSTKRPAVAARKAKALKSATHKQTGKRGKPESRTPDSFKHNKKARR